MALPARLYLVALLTGGLALAGCDRLLDGDQVSLCRQTLPAVNPAGTALAVTAVTAAPAPDAVRIDYDATDGKASRARWVACGFNRDGVEAGRHLVTFATETERYTPVRLFLLDRFWLHREAAVQADPGPGEAETPLLGASRPAAIAVQAVLDGLPHIALLVLVAAGYGLVYGLIGRLNLAFSAIAALGAVGAGLGLVASEPLLGALPLAQVAAAILAGGAVAALYGFATDRLVFAPLAGRPGQAVLVATLAVAIALSEFLLVSQGPATRGLPERLSGRVVVAGGEGFSASISVMGLLTTLVAALLCLGLLVAMRTTGLGRRWRAVSQDAGMATLLGIAPGRILAASAALAGAFTGVAGALSALSLGEVDVAAGARIGLTALLAAVLGGIGSVEGAMLGALAIGIVETAWGAVLPLATRDAGVLALTVLAIILRPEGLLGLNR